MEDGDQKVKPENNDGGVGNDQITIIVKQQGHAEIQFKIKKKTKMGKVMDAFCKKEGISTSEDKNGKPQYPLRFIDPEGKRINAEQTALDLELEDGDQSRAEELKKYVSHIGAAPTIAVCLSAAHALAKEREKKLQNAEAVKYKNRNL